VNIGSPDEHTVADLARIVLDVTGSGSPVVHPPLPIDDPARRKPAIELARRILGWSPEFSLRDGVLETVDWFRRTTVSEAPAVLSRTAVFVASTAVALDHADPDLSRRRGRGR
jgi:UDP-glucose 4-epimerase